MTNRRNQHCGWVNWMSSLLLGGRIHALMSVRHRGLRHRPRQQDYVELALSRLEADCLHHLLKTRKNSKLSKSKT